MKKTLAMLIALMVAISLVACSDKNTEETVNKNEENVQVENDFENKEEETSEENKEEDSTAEDSETAENPQSTPESSTEQSPETQPQDKPESNADNEPQASPAPTAKPENDNKPQADNKPADKPETNTNVPENNEKATVGNQLLSEFKTVAGSKDAMEIAEKLASSSAVGELSLVAMEVTPGYLSGFDNTEIKGFKEGAMFAPMISSIPFVGYVFTVEDGADTATFSSTLKNAANLRWNL